MTSPKAKLPKVVAIGGGSGLSVIMRGLKRYPLDLTAIVTVADDGGSTGSLREELGIPAVGDIRKVITALSETEPLTEEVFKYRFQVQNEDGRLHGHALGNLLLAAMTDVTGDFTQGVREISKILNVKGKVLPSTSEVIDISAEMEDGTQVFGESKITEAGKKIKRIRMTPEDAVPLKKTVDEIKAADLIIIAPGSLYTSIIPNLLFAEISDAIKNSKAKRIYICNIMTQHGETTDYSVACHVDAINYHAGDSIIDTILVNASPVPDEILEKYLEEKSTCVTYNKKIVELMGIEVVEKDFATYRFGNVRHDYQKIAAEIYSMIDNGRAYFIE